MGASASTRRTNSALFTDAVEGCRAGPQRPEQHECSKPANHQGEHDLGERLARAASRAPEEE